MENIEQDDNLILKIIHDLYKDYAIIKDELPKQYFFRLIFENKLMDVCDYNIFYFNHYANEITDEDFLTYQEFLKLIFFIYGQQLKMIKSQKVDEDTFSTNTNIKPMTKNSKTKYDSDSEEEKEESPQEAELKKEIPNDINELTVDSYNVILDKDKFTFMNNTIIKIMKMVRYDHDNYIDIVIPDYEENDNEFYKILSNENLVLCKEYSDPLYHIFCSNSNFHSNKNIQLMNISDLIRIIWEKNIYNNIESSKIAKVISKYLCPIKINFNRKDIMDKYINIFDDPKLKNSEEAVKKYFDNINLDSTKINFTFSSFVMILTEFSLLIPDSVGKDYKECLEHFFQTILEIEKNDLFGRMENMNENESYIDEDSPYMESKILVEARRMQQNPEKIDMDYLLDSLKFLDKDLPEMNALIKSLENPKPNCSNYVKGNEIKIEKLPFPLNTLQVEIDEMKGKMQKEKDQIKIDKLKGAKKASGREAPPKPVFFEDIPDKKLEEVKYFGNKTVETLKGRLIKNSYKDILMNSNVYPCLIKEVMVIPKKLHVDVNKK
jgi:hypothetical protein